MKNCELTTIVGDSPALQIIQRYWDTLERCLLHAFKTGCGVVVSTLESDAFLTETIRHGVNIGGGNFAVLLTAQDLEQRLNEMEFPEEFVGLVLDAFDTGFPLMVFMGDCCAMRAVERVENHCDA